MARDMCDAKTEVFTGLVKVELDNGDFFFSQRGKEKGGELIFPVPISGDTIEVAVAGRVKRTSEVAISDILLRLNYLAAYRPKIDPEIIVNSLRLLMSPKF